MRLLAMRREHNQAIALFNAFKTKLKEELAIEPMGSTVNLLEKINAARAYQKNLALPRENPHFVGRENELAKVRSLIGSETARLITLLGPGGVGKSSLGLALAYQLEPQFLNGAFYIPLAALRDPQLIAREVATAVNFKAQHNQNFDQQLIQFLSNRELLLVLDNFEHLLAGRPFITNLLQATNDVVLIVTSRETLNLQQEHRLILEGLPFPQEELDHQQADLFASYQLFVTQAKKVAPAFDPKPERFDILKICQLLQGMPLGLELSAAQLELQTVKETLTAISDNFHTLQKEWGDRPDRHHSLQAAFLHSWRQLPTHLQTVLGQLSVFQGGFTAKFAQDVIQASRQDLAQLLNKSLLQYTDQSAGRFSLHPVVQQFSAEAISIDLIQTAQTAHATNFLQMVQSFQDNDGYAIENLENTTQQLTVELDNIRQGWQTAVSHQNLALLAPTLVGMSKLYASQSWFQEGASLFEWTINQLQSLFDSPRSEKEQIFWGHLNGFAAGMFLYLSETEKAKTMAKRAIATLEPLPAPDELGYAWNMLGISLLYQGKFQDAIDALETSQQTYAKTNNLGQMLGPLINLGSVYQRVGNYEQGLKSLMEAYDISEQINDPRGSTHLLNNIGGILFSMGRLEEAIDYFERCNQLSEETGYPMVQAGALLNLAELQLKMETGNSEKITAYLEEGLTLSQKIGDKQKEARAHKLYADFWLQMGSPHEAHRALKKGLNIVWPVKALPTIFELLLGFANYFLMTENFGMATAVLAILNTHPSVPQHLQTQAQNLTQNHALTLLDPIDLDSLYKNL